MIIAAGNAEAGLGQSTEISQSTSSDFDILDSFTLTPGYISAISVNISWSAQMDVSDYRVQYRPVGESKRLSMHCTMSQALAFVDTICAV